MTVFFVCFSNQKLQLQTQLKVSFISYVVLNQLLKDKFNLIYLFDFLVGAVDVIVFVITIKADFATKCRQTIK